MCVHVSICTPTLFGKWGYIWDVCFHVLFPLTAHQKTAQFSSQEIRGKSIFAFFYRSRPDFFLTLPHAEKTKWKC